MASKRKAFLSRSVSLSLAALIVLTGAMFLITTLEQDHQEWKLVEDQVVEFVDVRSSSSGIGDDALTDFDFDEETSTYTVVLSGGDKSAASKWNVFTFAPVEGFDYSKNYKFSVVSSDLPIIDFGFYYGGNLSRSVFDLKNIIAADDGSYSANVILLDQLITDLQFQDVMYFNTYTSSNTSTFQENTLSLQVYELQDDNAGSVAAAITGLVLIVMGVFATPMLNVFRRR